MPAELKVLSEGMPIVKLSIDPVMGDEVTGSRRLINSKEQPETAKVKVREKARVRIGCKPSASFEIKDKKIPLTRSPHYKNLNYTN